MSKSHVHPSTCSCPSQGVSNPTSIDFKSLGGEREHDTSLLCNRSSSFVTVRRVQQTSKTILNLSGNSAIVVLVDLFHISTFVGGLHCCDGYGEDSGPPARRSRMRRKMVTRLDHFT